jgi:hypothetical protein
MPLSPFRSATEELQAFREIENSSTFAGVRVGSLVPSG